jgi:hypothetical protein
MPRSLAPQALAAITLLLTGLLAPAGVAAPATRKRATPAPGSRTPPRPAATPRKPPPPIWKTRPPQIISVTAHPAETRLARFIRALYAGRRAEAASLLASTVPPVERQALIEKRWLRESPAARNDVTQILFLPDIQIRTRALYADGVECYVISRKALPRRRKGLSGYLKVRMREEQGGYYVDMRPSRLASR